MRTSNWRGVGFVKNLTGLLMLYQLIPILASMDKNGFADWWSFLIPVPSPGTAGNWLGGFSGFPVWAAVKAGSSVVRFTLPGNGGIPPDGRVPGNLFCVMGPAL